MKRNMVESLIDRRKKTKLLILKKIITKIILFLGADIPIGVSIGDQVGFAHNALGTVINSNVIIKDKAAIFHNVTIGRATVYSSQPIDIVIEEGAIICAGAKVLTDNKFIVGKNSIIAANAVLLNSTGEGEIWGGVPARLIRKL